MHRRTDSRYIVTMRKQNYSIRFNANGGSGKMKDTDIAYGTALPKNIFRAPAGKTFKGWSDTPGLPVKFIDREEFRPNVTPARQLWTRLRYGSDIVLYAVWE